MWNLFGFDLEYCRNLMQSLKGMHDSLSVINSFGVYLNKKLSWHIRMKGLTLASGSRLGNPGGGFELVSHTCKFQSISWNLFWLRY